MAKIGLNSFRYGILTEAADGTPSYGGAKTPAKAVSCNVSITSNSAELYADDVLAESDYSFQNGTITMGIDDEDLATQAELLGHTYSAGAGVVRNANDTAPYVGIGRVIVKMIGGVRKYKVEFLYKCKFSEPNQDDTTKGEALAFGTSEISGSVHALANGNWSTSKVFNTQAEAVQYLEALLATSAVTLTYNVNGGTGSVPSVLVASGTAVALDNGAGITPPANKTFAGWATTNSAETADVTSPYTVSADTTLYAVYAAG